MTFYEAALSVLEREGKPLHVNAIVERAVKDNLLSHVGKSPEEVMQSRLLAMARRRNDRKICATAPQTYALVEWALPEDPAALEPVVEAPLGADEPPLRPRERHPAPSPDKARVAGRGSERLRKSRREEEIEERKKRRKLPPLSEVAFEILSQAAAPMSPVDIAAAARDRELVSEDLGAEALLHALREENRRRTEAGRKPAFSFLPGGEVAVEKAAESTVELEAAVAYALGVPLTEPKREERGPGAARLLAQAADHRRQIARLVRRRLGDLDLGALERAGLALLEKHGYKDLRPTKRGKDAITVLARKREGLSELRYAVRLQRGSQEIPRGAIEELRQEAAQAGAHLALLLGPGDASRDARHEAQKAGSPLVILHCGDALAELCLEAKIGCATVTVEVFDLDDDFFKRLRGGAREERRDRPAREEHERRPVEERRGPQAPAPVAAGPAESDAARQQRRQEEAQLRAAAHERIEAAELAARGKPGDLGTAAS